MSCFTQNPCYSAFMNRNLTLTLDEGLLLSARKVALEQGTSVNAMVRDYLTDLSTLDPPHGVQSRHSGVSGR